jgi:hypothetical protein
VSAVRFRLWAPNTENPESQDSGFFYACYLMAAGPSLYTPSPDSPPTKCLRSPDPETNTQDRIDGAFSFVGVSAFASNATGQLRFASGMIHGSTYAVSAAES